MARTDRRYRRLAASDHTKDVSATSYERACQTMCRRHDVELAITLEYTHHASFSRLATSILYFELTDTVAVVSDANAFNFGHTF